MHTDSENYKRYVNARAKKSPLAKDCVRAFLTGGAICAGAQGLMALYKSWGMEKDDAAALVSVSLVFLAALLTGLGVFDNIAKWAGAGTLVPITGFANAVAAPAIDTKGEGFVLGVGAKIFSIAGPVILYGMAAGTVYGVIYWIIQTFF
ncbi:MAG: SpoVA/SpoVAEb family sporulation membrane protein [Clostridia bacterium]|nr:SpoVA/SpoVAEb family sporulation membrane protein [Clostridia bacterium]